MPVLEFIDVVAGYKIAIGGLRLLLKRPLIVLNGVSFSVPEGHRLAVVGESGSGKTTLVKVALGLLKPFRGEVLVYSTPIYKLPWKDRVKVVKTIGYVPQDPYKALNPLLKVERALLEPLETLNLSEKEAKERVLEALELVKLPKSILEKTPGDLSGGMRQRVLIARALIHRPRLLILDEPTSALDVSIQAQIINLLNEIHSKLKIAMVTVTHDLSVAQYLADDILVLKNGRIVEKGSFEEVISSPRSEYTRTLIASYYKLFFGESNMGEAAF